AGALVVLVAVQLSVLGLYLPPVLRSLPLLPIPPQTIISLPLHTAVCQRRASGALVTLGGVHVSSVQPPEGPAITGSVELALTAAIVTGTCASALASHHRNGSFSHATVASF